ncbi:MAG: signal recognition particle-docking protein FtsY [Ilumatobacteraceae bacterium]|jgi:fused signal recognition particle receptor
MEQIFLVLIAVVLVFGIGVVIVNRRRSSIELQPDRTSEIARPPRPLVEPRPAVTEPVEVEPVVEEAAAAPAVDEIVERPSVRSRLGKARSALTGAFLGIRGRAGITDETWDELEEALLRADVGVTVTNELLGGLRARVRSKEIDQPDALLDALRAEMSGRLEGADRALHLGARAPGSPTVWLFVGVNGVGKTTTIGKVGALQRAEGRTVLMAAGDTFRAAAAEQLATWAERSGSEFVRGSEGGDPSSVIFDGVERAAARDIDLVLGDTAGRLHTKTNLMDELRKVRRVAGKGAGRVEEVLLVIDATTGQNGLTQARQFGDALEHDDAGVSGLTGVVLTKLDGSAKGGIVFAIETELGVPVKLVGLGETINDLVPFDPVEFVDALFADS